MGTATLRMKQIETRVEMASRADEGATWFIVVTDAILIVLMGILFFYWDGVFHFSNWAIVGWLLCSGFFWWGTGYLSLIRLALLRHRAVAWDDQELWLEFRGVIQWRLRWEELAEIRAARMLRNPTSGCITLWDRSGTMRGWIPVSWGSYASERREEQIWNAIHEHIPPVTRVPGRHAYTRMPSATETRVLLGGGAGLSLIGASAIGVLLGTKDASPWILLAVVPPGFFFAGLMQRSTRRAILELGDAWRPPEVLRRIPGELPES